MANLTSTFSLNDQITAGLNAIANVGENAMQRIESGAESAARSIDGVAESVESVEQSVDAITRANTQLDSLLQRFSATLNSAKDSLKSMSEELDGNGQATVDQVYYQRKLSEAIFNAEKAWGVYNQAMESGTATQEQYVDLIGQLDSALNRLDGAAQAAAESMGNLNEEMKPPDTNIPSGGQTAVGGAAVPGNTVPTSAMQGALDNTRAIASALAAAGITKFVKNAVTDAYALANSFDAAQSSVIMATGATGEALDSLSESMMDIYAKEGNLQQASALVGELNTRFHLTGEELENTASLFYDFQDATGQSAVASVRTLSQLTNQWGLETKNVGSLMDKLTVAGQNSGISLNALSSELTSYVDIFNQLGFSIDEAIAMLSQFELYGVNVGSVMMGVRQAVAKGAVESSEELFEVFDKLSSGAMTAADAVDMFGSRAGKQIASAAQIGALELKDMISALEQSEGKMKETADAAETLSDKWEKAGASIGAAFTKTVEKPVNAVSEALANATHAVGDFLNQHQGITTVLTAVATGLGAVALGIAGVSAASLKAIPAVAALGVTLKTAFPIIGAVAAGISLVTGLVLAFSNTAVDAGEQLTATSQAQADELANLTAEYEAVCAAQGETSQEANLLRAHIMELQDEFESSKQTINEFSEACQRAAEMGAQARADYDQQRAEYHEQELDTMALIARMEELANKTDRTTFETEQLRAVYDALSESTGGLSTSFETLVSSPDAASQSIEAFVQSALQADRRAQLVKDYTAKYLEREQIAQTQDAADKEQTAAEEALTDAEQRLETALNQSYEMGEREDSILQAQLDVAAARSRKIAADNNLLAANQGLADADDALQKMKDEWDGVTEATEEAADSATKYENALVSAFTKAEEGSKSVQQQLTEIYESVHKATVSAIDSTLGLFNTLQTKSDLTYQQMDAGMESQITWMATYEENIRKAQAAGLDSDLLAQLADGTQKSAGQLNEIISQYETLGASAVENINNQFARVKESRKTLESALDEVKLGADDKVQALVASVQEKMEGLDVSGDAATAAEKTVDAYIAALIAGESQAEAAAKAIASGVSAALSNVEVNVNFSTKNRGKGGGGPQYISVDGFAAGTTDSSDVFVAGENGPELYVGYGGGTVFPADETERIIGAVNDYQDRETYALPESEPAQTSASYGGGSDKKITLEIAGSGSIQVSGDVDKEAVVEILMDNIKPVLIDIISEEIFQEGDGTYDY